MRTTDTHIYFYGSDCPFSNFYLDDLEIHYNNHIFTNSEQLFMWHKAEFFRDHDAANDIIEIGTQPKIAKRIGREVKGFDEKKWAGVREHYMYLAVQSKFESKRELKNYLMDTYPKILVESSPSDRIWGVGLSCKDDRILDENNWLGLNLLGQVLMEVRSNYINNKF